MFIYQVPTAPPPSPTKVSILFVCLGNICRSPMAEAVFRSLTTTYNKDRSSTKDGKLEFIIDSAGTAAYHEGNNPDPRTINTLRKNGIEGYEHSARKVRAEDFWTFDWVLAMDETNFLNLERMRARVGKEEVGRNGGDEGKLAEVRLFGDFGEKMGEEVVDPYYGEGKGFAIAFEQVERFGIGLLEHLRSS